jgi:hypothetical protein
MSASNGYFEMGVAVPIKNHKFRMPYVINTTVNTSYTLGTDLIINDVGGIYYKMIKKGDSIYVGESTNTTHAGKAENVQVVSTDYLADITTITISSALDYDYQATDPIKIYASKHPNHWELTSAIERNPVTITPAGGGKTDRYACFQRANTITGYGGIEQTFDTNPFLVSTIYRGGCQYKYQNTIVSGATLDMQVSDGISNIIANQIASDDVFSWTRFTKGTYQIISAANLSSAGAGHIKFLQYLASAADTSEMFIDEVFLEHASGLHHETQLIENCTLSANYVTVYDIGDIDAGDYIVISGWDTNGSVWARVVKQVSSASGNTINFSGGGTEVIAAFPATGEDYGGKVEKVGNGYYEFDDAPYRESVIYDRVDNVQYLDVAPNLVKRISNMFGDKTERWYLRCVFNAQQSTYTALKKFLQWQDRGYMLNLHSFITDLPSVMTGFMEVKELSKPMFDFSYRKLQLTFIEATV